LRETVSAQLHRWLDGDDDKPLDGLITLFGLGSFALPVRANGSSSTERRSRFGGWSAV
jgi:hypothetical protein